MTQIQMRIMELFEALTPQERAEILDRLAVQSRPSIFDGMTPEQRAELDRSIAEADRGEGKPAREVMAAIAEKYGVSRAAE